MTGPLDVEIATYAERPDRAGFFGLATSWPRFMQQDPTGALFYDRPEAFGEFVLLARDRHDGSIVARACSVPYSTVSTSSTDGGPMPDDGWDGVVRAAVAGLLPGAPAPDACSALEVAISREHLGAGLSGVMLTAMRDNAARLGFAELVAPVRPNGKADPHQPMADHAAAVRADGLPVDPWLRVHVRAGGVVERVAPRSMVISGSVEQWREWTGLAFDTTGPVDVPGALAPVWCDAGQGTAVYVEPDVWVRHRTGV